MPLPFETAGSVQHLFKREKTLCPKCVNRAALIEPETKLGGIVEVDETFVGGKEKNKHASKRQPDRRLQGDLKSPVVTLIDRDGEAAV